MLALSIAVAAQSVGVFKARPGDGAINGSVIRPYKNLWLLTYTRRNGESVEAGTWSDEVKSVKVNGHMVLERRQVARYNKNNLSTTLVNVFNPRTLVPISMSYWRDSGDFHQREFYGAKVIDKKFVTPPGGHGEARETEVRLAEPVFDFFGGMYGLLISAFPLKEGYAAELPAIDEEKNELVRVKFRVLRRESVEAGANRRTNAWVVASDTSQGNMVFWLTQKPPYVIKLILTLPNGLVATYSMV